MTAGKCRSELSAASDRSLACEQILPFLVEKRQPDRLRTLLYLREKNSEAEPDMTALLQA
jgi:hypothetical protein